MRSLSLMPPIMIMMLVLCLGVAVGETQTLDFFICDWSLIP